MVNLIQLQQLFQDYLLNKPSSIFDWVSPQPNLTVDERLAIYFEGYRLRLLEVLSTDFPITKVLMGEEAFVAIFIQYLLQYPSMDFSVRTFGHHFPHFLLQHDSTLSAEMARFEWILRDCTNAPTAPIATLQQLQQLAITDWPNLILVLHPSVKSDWFSLNTPLIWQQLQDNTDIPLAKPEPLKWLFWRQGISAKFQACTAVQAHLFAGIEANLTFGELCESLLNYLDEEAIPMQTVSILQHWLTHGLISELRL